MGQDVIKPAPIIAVPNVPVTRVKHRRRRMAWHVAEKRDVEIPAVAITIRSGKHVRMDRQGDW